MKKSLLTILCLGLGISATGLAMADSTPAAFQYLSDDAGSQLPMPQGSLHVLLNSVESHGTPGIGIPMKQGKNSIEVKFDSNNTNPNVKSFDCHIMVNVDQNNIITSTSNSCGTYPASDKIIQQDDKGQLNVMMFQFQGTMYQAYRVLVAPY